MLTLHSGSRWRDAAPLAPGAPEMDALAWLAGTVDELPPLNGRFLGRRVERNNPFPCAARSGARRRSHA